MRLGERAGRNLRVRGERSAKQDSYEQQQESEKIIVTILNVQPRV